MRARFAGGIDKGEKLVNKESSMSTPLTLEQLRGMVGQWVWVVVNYDHDGELYKCDGWALITTQAIVSYLDQTIPIDFYGKKFVAYAYPPTHIDREAWTGCPYCGGVPHMEGVELKPCASGYIGAEVAFGKCRDDQCIGMVVYYRNAAAGYLDFDYCPFCGKPQTPKAWYEQEKRLMALMN